MVTDIKLGEVVSWWTSVSLVQSVTSCRITTSCGRGTGPRGNLFHEDELMRRFALINKQVPLERLRMLMMKILLSNHVCVDTPAEAAQMKEINYDTRNSS